MVDVDEAVNGIKISNAGINRGGQHSFSEVNCPGIQKARRNDIARKRIAHEGSCLGRIGPGAEWIVDLLPPVAQVTLQVGCGWHNKVALSGRTGQARLPSGKEKRPVLAVVEFGQDDGGARCSAEVMSLKGSDRRKKR